MKTVSKVMPHNLLCWLMTSEADVDVYLVAVQQTAAEGQQRGSLPPLTTLPSSLYRRGDKTPTTNPTQTSWFGTQTKRLT